MHLHVITLICCALLSSKGYADEQDCKRKDVPRSVQEILLKVIKESCPSGDRPISVEKYDCALGEEASGGKPSEGSPLSELTFFDSKSNFDFNWSNSLSNAFKKTLDDPRVHLLCAFGAKKIGCSIGLSTSNDTGIHELNLRCNYQMALPSTV